ncbi:MAG: PilZ domain-containing protein [Xanthobacteraceae bacterium]|jgi:PilZ domain
MKPPTDDAAVVDDRRVAPKDAPLAIEDRRVAASDRRISPRMRTLKGGQIFWSIGSPVTCIVRNLSETGACLEVHTPVPQNFELVFDGNELRRSCRVVWRKESRIGVKFK